jgi:SSS family solute:Na+ symporter
MPLTHTLSWLDLAVFGGYLAGLLALGIHDRRRQLKAREHFLAGNSASWPKIGFALYASTISATSLVGLTGAAYSHGISVFNYEWMAAIVLTIFCAFVLPTYIRSQVFTVPEFLELRYGKFVRTYVSGLGVILGVFLDAAGGLFAGALLFQILVPDWPLWQVCALLAVLAGGFLIAGGLRAVLMVESIQGVVMVIVASGIAFFTFRAVGSGSVTGGWTHMMQTIDPSHLKLVLPANDPDMPWTGLLTGVPLIGFYFWCTNQIMVQRVLAAKSLDHGRWGSLMGGALKLTNLFLVILPGAAALLLFPHLAQPDRVFSHIVFEIMPHGLVGLIVAACLISILSNLSGVYNSTSTLLTMDFIRKLKPDMTDVELVRTGQIITVFLIVISVMWTPQIVHFQDTLWKYLQAVLCYFVPPIAAVFIAGLFIRRVNRMGAVAGLILGTSASLVLFIDAFAFHVFRIHFLVAAVVIFVVAFAALLIGSLFSPAPDPATVNHLMFAKSVWQAETTHLKTVKWYQNYRYLSVALLLLTGAVVLCFA